MSVQEQSVNAQELQSSQLALPKPLPPLRALDLAQGPSQPAQIQGHQVDAAYAELVEKLRDIVHKLQEQGHSPELNAQLEQQCSIMVGHPACWSVYKKQYGIPACLHDKLGFETSVICTLHQMFSCFALWPTWLSCLFMHARHHTFRRCAFVFCGEP